MKDPPGFTRELRRLWEIEIYDGDPDDPETPIKVETVVAFNAVMALHRCPGRAAKQPREICFVTWPPIGQDIDEIFEIRNTKEGPIGMKIMPSIPLDSGSDEAMSGMFQRESAVVTQTDGDQTKVIKH